MHSSKSRSSSGSSALPCSGAGSRSARHSVGRVDVAADRLLGQADDVVDAARDDGIGHRAHLVA